MSSAVLDRLERRYTKPRRQKRPPPKWVLWLSPSLRLLPTECIPQRMFRHEFLWPLLPIMFIVLLVPCSVLAEVIYKYPFILTHRRLLLLVIGMVNAHMPFIDDVLGLAFLLAFNFLLQFPRFYFWNRRARRLQAEATVGTEEERQEKVVADATVWPPPPGKYE